MRKIFLIDFLLCFIVVVCVSFVGAEQTEKAKDTSSQKQKVSTKKKLLKIKPGDVYPGDAAVAGYNEDLELYDETRERRIYKIENKLLNRTYIFSIVEGVMDYYGYFRVLRRHGYGKEEKNEREHLIYAKIIGAPSYPNPLRLIKTPKGESLVILFNYDQLAIYNAGKPETETGLWHLDQCVNEQNITDVDGDGWLEIRAYTNLTGIVSGCYEANIPAIYKYIIGDKDCGCSKFVRVKGKKLEKIFMEEAEILIGKEYPKRFKKVTAKSAEDEIKQLNKTIEGWLAAVESTENPELIKAALKQLKKLPYPSEEEKQKILEKLIQHGYPMLKTN